MAMGVEYYYTHEIVELFECDPQFLDDLEAEELITPVRIDRESERVFPPEQVERIRIITNLMRDLDVNLPGAAVILEMREQMLRMQERFDRILEALHAEFESRER